MCTKIIFQVFDAQFPKIENYPGRKGFYIVCDLTHKSKPSMNETFKGIGHNGLTVFNSTFIR